MIFHAVKCQSRQMGVHSGSEYQRSRTHGLGEGLLQICKGTVWRYGCGLSDGEDVK